MSNFIKDLDSQYKKEREKNRINKKNQAFICNIPIKIELYGNINENYMIRKGKFTKFLYIANNSRVYFTDADIITMLLQIKDECTVRSLIGNLKRAYWNFDEKYDIYIGKEKYELECIAQIENNQVLTNPQDIDISFNELLVLINLILSKDRASNPLWPGKPDFLKHTISKYISLIKYYYYGDIEAKNYLSDMGYNVDEDVYANYNTSDKRDEKRGFFSDFKVFEKSGIL